MALKRLESGVLLESPAPTGELPAHLDKPVLLVYTGNFKSIDGDVPIGDEDIERLASTHGSFLEGLKRLVGNGEVPVRLNPPLQLDHSTSARDTIGRLIGPVKVAPYKLSDGSEVKGLFGTMRFLGKENVEKAVDGRYSNVSIGADFATGKISELSITPFPAAEEARMLSAATSKTEGESTMDLTHYAKGLKHHLDGLARHLGKHLEEAHKQEHGTSLEGLTKHLVEVGPDTKDMAAVHGPLKAHLELAKKHLESVKTIHPESHEGLKHHLEGLKHHLVQVGPDTQEMAAHAEAMAKHLEGLKPEEPAAPSPGAEHEAKMTAIREGITKLAAGQAKMVQQSRKAKLSARVSHLRAAAKITPAEIKKMDLTKLAAESDATVEAVFKTYEDREPVILTGMMGTSKAENLAEVSKKARMSKLEHEMRLNMPLKRTEYESRLKRMAETGENEVNVHIDALPGGEHDTEMAAIHKLMDEGKIPEAKEKLKHFLDGMKKHLAEAPGEEGQKEMSELAEDVKKMQTELDGLKKLAGL